MQIEIDSLGCDYPDKWPHDSISSDKNRIKLPLPVQVRMPPYHFHLVKASLFPSQAVIAVCYLLLCCNAVKLGLPQQTSAFPVTQVSEWKSANSGLFGMLFSQRQSVSQCF